MRLRSNHLRRDITTKKYFFAFCNRSWGLHPKCNCMFVQKYYSKTAPLCTQSLICSIFVGISRHRFSQSVGAFPCKSVERRISSSRRKFLCVKYGWNFYGHFSAACKVICSATNSSFVKLKKYFFLNSNFRHGQRVMMTKLTGLKVGKIPYMNDLTTKKSEAWHNHECKNVPMMMTLVNKIFQNINCSV